MKKLIILLSVTAGLMAQQPAPNVLINFGPWTDVATSQTVFNAGTLQAAYWVMSYQTTGFSAVSLQFESATGVAGAPGSFGAFQGTTVSGSNPSTSVTCSTPNNCRAVFSGITGWVRVRFVSHTGSGTIQGTLQGYKTYQALGGDPPPSGSGCVGTVGTPCIVAGPDVGSGTIPPTKNPVLIAGVDGDGNVNTIQQDTGTDGLLISGVDAPGNVPSDTVVSVGGFDGTDTTRVKTDTGGNLQTGFIGFSTFNAGQQAVTGSAVALATHTARAVCVVALAANTIPIYIGPSGVTTTTGLELAPGASTCQPVNNSNLIFVVASTTGASASWSLVN